MVGVAARVQPTQLDFLRPCGPAPAALASTLARLAVLCGAERVGVLRRTDSHRPDAVEVGRFEFGVALEFGGEEAFQHAADDEGSLDGVGRNASREHFFDFVSQGCVAPLMC